MNEISKAASDVLAERARQIEHHGWTASHDDEHLDGSLAMVAALYTAPIRLWTRVRHSSGGVGFYDPWPNSWDASYDKRFYRGAPDEVMPQNNEKAPFSVRRRLLVKAAAMTIAEIERLDRIPEALRRA